jgi:hypothetical protein
LLDRFPILIAVQEKLALANEPFSTTKTMQEIVQVNNLFHGVRRARLLSIPERCIRYPDLVRRVDRD